MFPNDTGTFGTSYFQIHFKASPLVAAVLSLPALSEFDLKEKEILKDASEITHAPLMAGSLL